jgi:ribosomal protein S18 acetylase RimI-like enzyme
MIEIQTLYHLNVDDLNRLAAGYTSPGKYVVAKTETPQRTAITLTRVALDEPYVKRWPACEAETWNRYQQVLSHGLSLGAYDGDALVGLALSEPRAWNRSLWVWEFHVAQTHRWQGIGRRLMDALAHRAVEAGLRVLVCETQNTNLPAIQFYRRAGLEIDGVDLSYYSNRDLVDGEVAIFMKRKLEP